MRKRAKIAAHHFASVAFCKRAEKNLEVAEPLRTAERRPRAPLLQHHRHDRLRLLGAFALDARDVKKRLADGKRSDQVYDLSAELVLERKHEDFRKVR